MKDTDRRLLPPMATLHAFAAAAAAGSFSRAAAEIGLTQGAVSRQVALLESWLGRTLFDRRGRRVMLNADGASYAAAIGPALSSIRRATRDAQASGARRAIDLATLPSFGMRWLAPRLPALSAVHPDIVVNLTARSDEFDFAHEQFDAAIHFGRASWPGATLDLLFRESSVPVVGAVHAAELRTPEDLLRMPLFVLQTRPDAWADWFELAHVEHGALAPAGSFSQFLMMAQAISAGAGVGLVPRFLVEPELAAAALVVPFDIPLVRDEAYYLARPVDVSSPVMDDFASWLLAEASARSVA